MLAAARARIYTYLHSVVDLISPTDFNPRDNRASRSFFYSARAALIDFSPDNSDKSVWGGPIYRLIREGRESRVEISRIPPPLPCFRF